VIREAASDDAAIDRWFGRFVTESRRGHYPEPPDDDAVVDGRDVRQAVEAGREIQVAAGVRMAYSRREDGWTSFFVGGEEYELDSELATMAVRFADKRKLTADDLAGTDRDGFEMLADLVNQGFAQIGEAESS
jgi:ribosomal protein L16 Arg81 hydroxylase